VYAKKAGVAFSSPDTKRTLSDWSSGKSGKRSLIAGLRPT